MESVRPASHACLEDPEDPVAWSNSPGRTDDPDPKALACYGLLWQGEPSPGEQIWLRFVTGRPVSAITTQFLDWCCEACSSKASPVWLLDLG